MRSGIEATLLFAGQMRCAVRSVAPGRPLRTGTGSDQKSRSSRAPELGGFLLPPGQLRAAGVGPGDLVGVRVTARGFEVEAVDERVGAAAPPTGLGSRVEAILAGRPEPDGPDQLDAVVWTACADDAGLLLPAIGYASARAADVRTVIDVNDVYALSFVVDAVEQPVGTTASTEQAGEFAVEGLADPVWLARQVAEGEFDNGRDNTGRDAV
jgi:hypothetical protein